MSLNFMTTVKKPAAIIGLFIFSIVAVSLFQGQAAFAANVTWDGGGGDNKFSTAANWSADTVPVTGDSLIFGPLSGGTDGETIYLVNDLVGVKFAGLVLGIGTGKNKVYSLDTVSFSNNATVGNLTGNGTARGSITFFRQNDVNAPTGIINGDGNITISAANISAVFNVVGNLTSPNVSVYLSPGSTIGGNLGILSGTIQGATITGTITLPASTRGLSIKGGTQTITNALVINQRSVTDVRNQLAFGNCATDPQSGALGEKPYSVTVNCNTYGAATYTLSGNLTLNADLVVNVAQNATVNFTGSITTNGYKIKKEASSQGVLQVAGTPIGFPEPTTVSYDGDDLTVTVTLIDNKMTGILNGSRYAVAVAPGGFLRGTGSARTIYVAYGGTINPGNSPGKLTTTSDFILDGAYTPELLNKDSYDQIIAGGDSNTLYGVRLMTNASLGTILYDGWKVTQGDQYRIIDNQGNTAINGTFKNLPEGAQFTVEGITFSITYTGGDGNDIVLTALNTGNDPTPPNTGVAKLIMANPVISAGLGLLTAGILIAIALRRRATK